MENQMNIGSISRIALLTGLCGLGACKSTAAPDPGPSVPAARAPASPALATAGDAKLRERLLALFSGYEHIVTRDELVQLGDTNQLTAALESLYRDPTVRPNTRVNALAALRFFPSPEVKALYEQALTASDTADDVRRSAVKAYGVGFGPQAVPLLGKMLEHPELHTRNAAAKSLGAIGDESAKIALRQHLPREQSALVKASIEEVLAKPEGKGDGKPPARPPAP
jgi:HEAT repeat protein